MQVVPGSHTKWVFGFASHSLMSMPTKRVTSNHACFHILLAISEAESESCELCEVSLLWSMKLSATFAGLRHSV